MAWQQDASLSYYDGNHQYTRYMDASENCGKMGTFGAAAYEVYTCDSVSVWSFDKQYGWGCHWGYYLALPGDSASNGNCSCEQGRVANNHPIEFGTGNMSESATDFVSGEGRLRFDRYYNSNPLNPDNGSYGWQNAYAMRHIYPIAQGIKSPLPSVHTPPTNVSGVYGSAAAACEQGISDIANGNGGTSPNPAYSGVTATYVGNGQCQLSNGALVSVLNSLNGQGSASPVSDASAGYFVIRPDGNNYYFTCSGTCHSTGQSEVALVTTGSGFTLTAENGDVETYDLNGNLSSIVSRDGYTQTITSTTPVGTSVAQVSTVTDSYGRVLRFGYNAGGLISTLTLPDQTSVQYGYDSAGRLASVTYPDNSVVGYQYANTSFPQALTAWIDESNNTYVTWTYDNTTGMATSSAMAGNVDTNTLSYGTNATTVTDNLGTQRTYNYQDIAGGLRLTSVSGPVCKECMGQSMTYDSNGFLKSAKDWNGNATDYTYGSTGLLQERIDAAGSTVQRATTMTWNTALRVPLTRTVLDANGNTVSDTQWVYNNGGQTLARCEIDPTNSAAAGYTCSTTGNVPPGVRRWTYTYCTAIDTTQCPIVGLLLTATSPRTDTTQTTTYSYYQASSAINCGTPSAACYQAGELHTITDPQGHVTTIASYDADGRITRLTDANGINTDMTYTPRGWLASRSVGGATTRFTYTPYGSVQTVTDPDGVATTYGYDAAHRLVKITDAEGNYTQYTLDAAGNKTAEQIYDASGTLHKSLSRSFNALGQLIKIMDGLNHTVIDASASNSYDANGNLMQSADGLGIQRQLGYDALNRLVKTIDNYNGTN